MEQSPGSSRVSATAVSRGDGDDDLLRAVRDATAGSYEVMGDLGRDASGRVIYLARDARTRTLVTLQLDGERDAYTLGVARTPNTSLVPIETSACGRCGAPLVDWGEFCAQCGAGVPEPARSRAERLHAMRDAARGEYEVLGEMVRVNGGGHVCFGRHLATGRLMTLRLRSASEPTAALAASSSGLTSAADPGEDPGAAPLGRAARTPAAPLDAGWARLVQPTAQRHTPQEVLLPADQLPADETLPKRPRQRLRPWVLVSAAAALVAMLAGVVFVRARLTAPDATRSDAGLGPARAAGTVAPGMARITLVAPLPRGGQVTVDGIAWRPPGVALPPGTYTLGADAPGYVPVSETRTLAAGDTLAWAPVFVAVRPAAPVAVARKVKPAPPRAAPVAAPAVVAAQPAPPPPTCQSAFDAKNWLAAVASCTHDGHAGDASAARNLGVMYERGYGVSKNPVQAATWFRAAAAGGSGDAAYQLAAMYDAGLGVAKDARQATEWYRKAAVLGNVDAQVKVGMAYENGVGVDVNPSEAVGWYSKAAGQGNAWAQNRLGWMYGMGRGVPRDDGRAVQYFREAADQGDAQAEYNVGFMYANGRGVSRDDSQAVKWFRKAAAQGYANAKKELERRGLVQ